MNNKKESKNMIKNYIKITNIIFEKMKTIDYLLPEEYEELFKKVAKEENISLDEKEHEKILTKSIISQIENLEYVVESSIVAIETGNTQTLKLLLEEVKKSKIQIEKLKQLIYLDTLTRVHNRKWLYDTYLDNNNIEMSTSAKFCLIDINDFKQINDKHGHAIGDKILIYMANKFQESGGEVVRFGGDEFIVIFEDSTSLEHINQTFSKIRNQILAKTFKSPNTNTTFKMSFSFGSVSFKSGTEFNNLLYQADTVMYQDKEEIKLYLKKMLS